MTAHALETEMPRDAADPRRGPLLAGIDALVARAGLLPADGPGKTVRIDVCLAALVALEAAAADQNADPYPRLAEMLAAAETIVGRAAGHPGPAEAAANQPEDEHAITETLFETAWTTFGPETYDHSVALVEARLARSGLGAEFLAGKTCFDGGCGTGRMAIALARAGAAKVVAADIGQGSLDYLDAAAARHGLSNIETVRQDITELSPWPADSFDFVVSNGVLHHTPNPGRGLREHFRIARPGGVLWLYLYGAGGLYWETFDRFKPLVQGIAPAEIRRVLAAGGVREGLIYTYLDNLLAPRVYYRLDEVLALFAGEGAFAWRHARGSSEIDDTEILLATAWGREIYGPQGEVRIAVTKGA